MMAAIWVGLGFAFAALLAALGDLISEEIRGWLDLVPRAILRLAAAQLDQAQRETIYRDEWLPELCYALRGAESRPITRLFLGTRYAFGLLIAARRISHRIASRRISPRRVTTTKPVRDWALTGPPVYSIVFTNVSGNTMVITDDRGRKIHVANGNTFNGVIGGTTLDKLAERGIRVQFK